MAQTQTLRTHAALVDRMSGAVGVDMEEMILRGRLQIDTLGDAVLACTGCSNPQACGKWLARNDASGEIAASTPEYCRNGGLFDVLKQGGNA